METFKPTKKDILNATYYIKNLERHPYLYAGFEVYNNEITIRINGGYPEDETYIKDIRGKSGVYEFHHEGTRECIKPNKRISKNIGIPPLELLERIEKLLGVYRSMRFGGDIYDLLPIMEKSYEKEKVFFDKDHYLALFWLMLFTITEDKRAEEIEKLFKNSTVLVINYFLITRNQILKYGYFIPNQDTENETEINENSFFKKNYLAGKHEILHRLQPNNFDLLVKEL